MPRFETVLTAISDSVGTLLLNRPDRLNAIDDRMAGELIVAARELIDDHAVRVIVITGMGRAFSAGGDVKFLGEALRQKDYARALSLVSLGGELVRLLRGAAKPVLGCVNGVAAGGGANLALACDLRIASENASFGQPEILLGIIPGGGGTQRLTRLVGEGKAMELILTGEIIDAQTAFAVGLVNHVVPLDQLEAKTMEIANRIAEKSPIALRLAKEAIRLAPRSNMDEGLRREVDLFALCFSSEDKDEGVKAFLEKRKPEFKGR